MKELLGRTWGLVVFRGVMGVIFGGIAMAWPEITLLALVILFGAYAVVDGITAIVMGIAGRGGERWLLIVTGLIGVIAGIVAFSWPGATALVLLWVIAFWAILSGFLYLVTAWRLRKEISGEWLMVLTGLASIALGIVLMVQPGSGALALVITIGIFAVVWGVFSILLGIRMRGISKTPDEDSIGTSQLG